MATVTAVRIDENSRAYKLFTGSIKSPSTRRTYSCMLPAFLRFAGFNSLDEMLHAEPKFLQDRLIDFVVEQRKTLSYATVNVSLAAVRKLCFMNDITAINWDKIYSFLGEHRTTIKDRIYSEAEIQKMMERASFRNKVIILILLSTGIRIGGLPELKLRHLTKIEAEGLFQFNIYENTREEYYTFCTPETSEAIDSYIEYRKRAGEEIGPNSPLIREEFDVADLQAVKNPKTLTLSAFRAAIWHLLLQTGIRQHSKTRERKELMLAHAFRKRFNTMGIKAGIKPVVKEMLMGHSVNLDNSYYKPTTDELMTEYLKAVDLLTVSKEKQLSHEVEKLKVETAEIDVMKGSYLDMKLELQAEREARQRLEAKVALLENLQQH